MATEITYWRAYERFRSTNTYEHVLTETLRTMHGQVVLDLSSVNTCLALGCGDGRSDLKFIKELAGNVTKFIGVERDHESTERLKDNLRKNLPRVDMQVIETDLRSWKGPDEQVDLVLLFNLLYYLNRNERQVLFHNLQQHWLTKGGYVAIVHATRRSASLALWEKLQCPLLVWDDIERDMLEAGFSKVHEYKMVAVIDHSDPDEYLLYFFQVLVGRTLTLDELRHAIKAASPDGKFQQTYCIAIPQRTH